MTEQPYEVFDTSDLNKFFVKILPMTRTGMRKLLSVAIVFSVISIYKFLFAVNGVYELRPAQRIVVVLAMVLLLNLPSFSLKKVFSARRLIKNGNYEEGRARAGEFIKEVSASRWRRLLCKFAIEAFTSEPQVLGYMCIGNAYRLEGQFDMAISTYKRAAEIDPLCPTVYVGLALVATAMDNSKLAQVYSTRSRELGFTGSITDRIFLLGGDLAGKIVLSVPAANA